MSKKLKICLLWHNLNSANYGVGALAIAHMDMVIRAAESNGLDVSVETVGTGGVDGLSIKNDLEARLNIKISHIEFRLRDIAKKLMRFRFGEINFLKNRNYDIVFDIGEGDSFADIYGIKRFFIFALSKWFVVRNGTPLVIAPQTVGPFKYGFTSRLAGYLLKKSVAVYVRDRKSSDFLKVIGVKHEVVSDVAFLLPYNQLQEIPDSVGINISGLLWHGGYTKNNQFNLGVDYQNLIVEAISGFLKRERQVYLISHVITDSHEVEDDFRVAQLVKNTYFKGNQSVVIAPRFGSPIEAKSYISKMKFFVGSRMHATIGALSSGVPTIPLAYSRKFSGVFDSINYPYTIELYGHANNEQILSALLDYYDNRFEELVENGNAAIKTAKQNLCAYSDYLQGILK